MIYSKHLALVASFILSAAATAAAEELPVRPVSEAPAVHLPGTTPSEATLELDQGRGLIGAGSNLEFNPQFSIFNASTLFLQTPDYRVDYGAILEGIPIFQLGMAVPYAQLGGYRFLMNSQIGFGTIRNVFPVKWANATTDGKTPPVDRVRLSWVPISLSTEVRYAVPGIPFFQPSLAVGAGGHLLLQRNGNRLPDQNFWLPHLFVRPALTFFDAASTAHWFGGFLFGVTWYHSVGKENVMRGTSFDLSLKFLL